MSTPTKLEQFNATYEAEQDRILLRFRLNTGAEFRFWLTRRFVSLLWPVLMKMSAEFSERKSPTNPLLRDTLSELAHGNAVNKANFGQAYQEGSEFPLGETPILLAKISVNPNHGENQMLTLLPQTGQGINLTVDENILHLFARLLQEASTKAEWGIEMRITGPNETPLPIIEAVPTKVLH